MTRDVKGLYDKLEPQIQAILDDLITKHCGKVSITLDAWTLTTQVPFLDITGHFIEPSIWKYKILLLGFEPLHGSHSAKALSFTTTEVL